MIENLLFYGTVVFGLLIGGSIVLLLLDKPVLVIYMQFGYCCFMRILMSDLGLPEFVKYLSDYFTVILFIQIVLQFNKVKSLNVRMPMLIITLFLIIAIISSALNISNGSFLFFLWGSRVYLRFYIFFLACTIFLERDNIDKMIKFLLVLLPINTILALFQYYILGLEDDFIGGLFGTERGSNTELVPYLLVVMTIMFIYYCRNKMNIIKVFLYTLMICIISALAELKTLFANLPVTLIMVFIISFPNKRIIKLLVTGTVAFSIMFLVFVALYPNWADSFESISKFIYDSATVDYAGEGSLSRTTAGSYLLHNVLITPGQKLFGFGFGNAGEFLSYTSSFLMRYRALVYHYFSYSLILVEIGILGLSIYCLFFLSILLKFLPKIKKMDYDKLPYIEITIIMSIQVFFLIIYNQSLNMDISFIIYFVLSFPFILEKEMNENIISLNKISLNMKGA